ncbi:hypothetical protein MKW92_027446 [Papaver armeniacum]|nr:hypothetical protein MKW92_027446 [Papaver armeniacum]
MSRWAPKLFSEVALYHVLLLDYVTISNLQSKLEGQANESSVRKLLDKMACVTV